MRSNTTILFAGVTALGLILASCGPAEQYPAATTTSTFAPGSVIFVSSAGSDANSGLTPSSPKATLDAGIGLARLSNSGRVFVSGNYTLAPGTGNSGLYLADLSNLTISGGWNPDFSANAGRSVLDANGACAHVVTLQNCRNVTLTNLLITGGYASNYYTFDGAGGGMFLANSHGNVFYCVVSSNFALFGGGVFLSNSTHNTIAGMIAGNTADSGGGIYFYYTSSNNNVSALISSNTASDGGGIYVDYAYSNTIGGTITRNMATDSGGGIMFDYADFNTVTGSITANSTYGAGGGAALYNSSGNVFASTAVIRYNHCNIDGLYSNPGGAIYTSSTGNSIQSGAIWSPNFDGAGTDVTNDLAGITAP